jgi:myo-inositol 2-dehydrogenase/D-chiro-inositol 1-dehydrogenase/scyllo-inositol 2-dehydrogenase (NAD+)
MVHARNFRWRVPHAELVSVVDVDAGRAAEAADELDLPGRGFGTIAAAMDAEAFDAVVITTPTFTHKHLALEAASLGVHVLCEKPMALDLDECDAMTDAAEAAGVVLQLAFMRRFDPPFVEAKRQIDAGAIGDPILVRSLTRGPGLPPAWANDVETSNGMLAEVNSHDFDAVRWLAGKEISEVYAVGSALKRPDLLAELPDFYDTAVVTLTLDGGGYGVIDGVCPVDYGYDARAEVVGTRGVLWIGELRDTATVTVTRDAGAHRPHFTTWRDRFRQAYVAEAEHFVTCIREGAAPRVGAADGRAAVAAVLAANRSLREHRPVALDSASAAVTG